MQERSWTSIFSALVWVILLLIAIRYLARAYPAWRDGIYAAGTFLIFGFWALDIVECARSSRLTQKREDKD